MEHLILYCSSGAGHLCSCLSGYIQKCGPEAAAAAAEAAWLGVGFWLCFGVFLHTVFYCSLLLSHGLLLLLLFKVEQRLRLPTLQKKSA